MFDSDSKSNIQQAEEYFSCAREEMYKPQEDVVNYMVCKCAYRSVYHVLKAYLLERLVEIPANESLENLQNLCAEHDSRFTQLKLQPLFHPMDEEDVWMDYKTSEQFLELATQTKELFTSIHEETKTINK